MVAFAILVPNSYRSFAIQGIANGFHTPRAVPPIAVVLHKACLSAAAHPARVVEAKMMATKSIERYMVSSLMLIYAGRETHESHQGS